MAAYLLTWNPKTSFPFRDLCRRAAQVATEGDIEMRWSCGRRKELPIGSRIFLLRQGLEPRGVYGAGVAISEPYEDDHWDSSRKDTKARYVKVKVDRLVDVDRDPARVVRIRELEEAGLGGITRNTQSSGIAISDSASSRIDELMQRRIGGLKA